MIIAIIFAFTWSLILKHSDEYDYDIEKNTNVNTKEL